MLIGLLIFEPLTSSINQYSCTQILHSLFVFHCKFSADDSHRTDLSSFQSLLMKRFNSAKNDSCTSMSLGVSRHPQKIYNCNLYWFTEMLQSSYLSASGLYSPFVNTIKERLHDIFIISCFLSLKISFINDLTTSYVYNCTSRKHLREIIGFYVYSVVKLYCDKAWVLLLTLFCAGGVTSNSFEGLENILKVRLLFLNRLSMSTINTLSVIVFSLPWQT